MIFSRRDILGQALALSFFCDVPAPAQSGALVIAEEHHLSRESAEAFHRLIASHSFSAKPVLVFAGASNSEQAAWGRTQAFRRRGGWVVWEEAPQAFPSDDRETGGLYASYSWPASALVRVIGKPRPLACSPQEAIASFDGAPVAFRRKTGAGGWIHLGSMLGPHIRWGDKEAEALAIALCAHLPFA